MIVDVVSVNIDRKLIDHLSCVLGFLQFPLAGPPYFDDYALEIFLYLAQKQTASTDTGEIIARASVMALYQVLTDYHLGATPDWLATGKSQDTIRQMIQSWLGHIPGANL